MTSIWVSLSSTPGCRKSTGGGRRSSCTRQSANPDRECSSASTPRSSNTCSRPRGWSSTWSLPAPSNAFSNVKVISTQAGGTIPFLVNRLQTLEHTFGVGPGSLELSSDEVREGVASFHHDLTAATSEVQFGASLKLVPASQMLMGLDLPFMPRTSFAAAIADLTGSPSLDAADRERVAHGKAERLFPALKARIEHRGHRLTESQEKV